MFSIMQYRSYVDKKLNIKKDLKLDEYSVILSDSAKKIDKKRLELQYDIVQNLKKEYIIR